MQIAALWKAVKQLQERLTSAAGGVPPAIHGSDHYEGGDDELDILQLGGYPDPEDVTRVLRGLYAGIPRGEALRLAVPQDRVFRLAGGAIEEIAA